jgi:hypothetical protein
MLARTPAGTPITVTEWTPPQVLAYLGDRVRIRHDLRAAWQDAPPGAHVAFWLPLEHGADVLRELIAESGDLLQDVPLPWRGATHRYLSAVRNRDKR